MGRRGTAAIFGTIVAIGLLGAHVASAATEVGNRCDANATGAGLTILQFQKGVGSDGLPSAVPSAGVLTEWKLTYSPQTAEPLPAKVKVLRPIPESADYLVVGEAVGAVTTGPNTFTTRIPVHAGDRLAMAPAGGSPTVFCSTGRNDDLTAAGFLDTPVGGIQKFSVLDNEIQVPVTAIVEADADGDGYGDESQDRCPANAAAQSCVTNAPVAPIALDTLAVAKRGSVLVLVSTSSEEPVTVSGTVSVAVRTKRANNSALLRLPASTQTVKPGQIGRFPMSFPKSLKSALSAVPPGKSLKLSIRVRATNTGGQVFEAAATAKLKGQAR